jgi:hypothetical protein
MHILRPEVQEIEGAFEVGLPYHQGFASSTLSCSHDRPDDLHDVGVIYLA